MIKRLWSGFKSRLLPYMIAYSAKIVLRLLLRTCRVDVHGLQHFTAAASQSPCILMLWHNRLVIVAEILNRFAPQFVYTALVSNSSDGKPLSLMALSYKAGRVLRVRHDARRNALKEMIAHLKDKRAVILITPDGPRGPRYVVKPGVALAAREAEAKVIPFSWKADRCWKLNTWDKMIIPKPFSTIKVQFGDAVDIQKKESRDLQQEMEFLQSRLFSLTS